MNRRKFIQRSAIGIPAWAFLASCAKLDFDDAISFKGNVAIIGAGASGMYAAHLLMRKGIQVTIYEASSRYGGRIRALEGFSDFPVELGAEEVHGAKSVWFDMMNASSVQFVESEDQDYFFVDNAVKSETQLEGDSDFQRVQQLLEEIGNYSGGEMTAQVYGNTRGITERVRHIWNAWVGNEHATDNTRIGMLGLAEEDQLWSSGEDNFLLAGRSCLSVLEEQLADVLPRIVLNTPIVHVNYTEGKVKLTDSSGGVYEADRVLVTIPITILNSTDIVFEPVLPLLHRQSMNKIGMGRGMKVILKFSQRFWPEDMGSLIGTGLVPEFWTTAAGRSANNNLLTAFVHGQNAETLSELGEGMIATILDELDTYFGAGVASGAYADHYIMDWGNEVYIKGAYSFPKLNTGNARELLAEPVASKIFFAGEATHTKGHFGTVHGALETAVRAAKEILTA